MTGTRLVVCLLAGMAIAVGQSRSAEKSVPASPQPRSLRACETEEFRQFDFWLGDWTVTNPSGQVVGSNRITLEHGGCVLQEHWTGAKGGTGSSLNIFDAATKHWHQTWVDNSGTLLLLDGGFVDGRMVLEGPGKGPKGERVTNRISWERLGDGRVRQTWRVSADGGKTWSVSFDGLYTKK